MLAKAIYIDKLLVNDSNCERVEVRRVGVGMVLKGVVNAYFQQG